MPGQHNHLLQTHMIWKDMFCWLDICLKLCTHGRGYGNITLKTHLSGFLCVCTKSFCVEDKADHPWLSNCWYKQLKILLILPRQRSNVSDYRWRALICNPETNKQTNNWFDGRFAHVYILTDAYWYIVMRYWMTVDDIPECSNVTRNAFCHQYPELPFDMWWHGAFFHANLNICGLYFLCGSNVEGEEEKQLDRIVRSDPTKIKWLPGSLACVLICFSTYLSQFL